MGHEETDARTSDHARGRFVDAATFGAFLRNRRESQNLSLRDVAAETKIAERYLAGLEQGDVRSWPGGIYRRGMVRAYATAVGLDPDSTVCEFADAFNEAPVQTVELALPSPVTPAFEDLLKVRPHATLCVGLALCGVIAVLTWAAPSSNAAGAIAAGQTRPVSIASARDDAATGTAVSGPPSAPSPAVQAPVELTIVTASEPAVVTATNLTVTPAALTAVTPVDQTTVTPPLSTPTPPPSPSSTDEPPAPASTDGSMQVLSEPAGAHVTVNGIQWGQTPVTIRYLEPGEKLVRITKDGYAGAERRIVLIPDQPTQEVLVNLAIEQ